MNMNRNIRIINNMPPIKYKYAKICQIGKTPLNLEKRAK
jgi:hypothetical protein